MSDVMTTWMTVGQVARHFAVGDWQIQRLFSSGMLPEPPRFSGKRMIRRDDLAAIEAALQLKGWLPGPAPARV